MTLIAFATYGDHAEFIHDSASYTLSGSEFGRCAKSMTLNHLDAAILTQGHARFGDDAKAGALQASGQVATFDELAATAPQWLRSMWSQQPHEPCDSTVFLIGYSTEAQAFAAYAYASEQEFKRIEVTRPWVMPTPWNLRPSDVELGRFTARRAGREDMARTWASKPTLPAPRNAAEWVSLAQTVREHRALEQTDKTFVAGDVQHTRLDRGAVTSRIVYSFDDSGEEFNRMVAGTHHPIGQVSPCHCGSGQRFIDCHLAPHLDEPCGCGSGDIFRECCMAERSATTA